MTKLVVVDQVLVAERDADHALHDQRLDLMLDQIRVTGVRKAGGQAPGQADDAVRGAEQQRPGIRGDPPAVE
jgi:hypothetical protein